MIKAGEYGNTVCRVFKWGVQNWKDFCLKINIPKGNYLIFRSQFSMSIFLKLGPYFFVVAILDNIKFQINWFSKTMPNFRHLPIYPISFGFMCCFLGKKLFNFFIPCLKTRQPILPYRRSNHFHLLNEKWVNGRIKRSTMGPKNLRSPVENQIEKVRSMSQNIFCTIIIIRIEKLNLYLENYVVNDLRNIQIYIQSRLHKIFEPIVQA